GALRVYGPQKGFNEKMIEELEPLQSDVVKAVISTDGELRDVSSTANIGGAGAGGGTGWALSLLGGTLVSGSILYLAVSDFDRHIEKSTHLLTGEGKLDGQSFKGKITGKVISTAIEKGKDILVIAGDVEDTAVISYLEDDDVSKKLQIRFNTIQTLRTGMKVYSIKRNFTDNKVPHEKIPEGRTAKDREDITITTISLSKMWSQEAAFMDPERLLKIASKRWAHSLVKPSLKKDLENS
ncbi:MAG: glycerate kinase, partial [Thermoplasmata archaeon]